MEIRHFEAVIFDMDGVLIDSEPLWKIAMQEVFRSVGAEITKEDFQKTVGLRIDEVIAYWHKERPWSAHSPAEVEELIVQKMIALIKENGTPLSGVVETLSFLRDQGFKIGLATSSYKILITTVLETLQISGHFDEVHSAEDELCGKPHPAVYLTVAERLSVAPHRCLVIEDSLNGIISAKAARMRVVCIPEKTHRPEPKLILADHTFNDMSELLVAIKRQL